MKKSAKIVLIVLALVVVLTILGAVIFKDAILGAIESMLDSIIDGDNGSTTVQMYELSMETNEKFEFDFYSGYSDEKVFISDNHLIGIYKATKEEIALPDQAPPTLEVYASLFFPMYVGLRDVESIPLNAVEGMLCYEADISGDGKPDNFVFFFEAEEAYWFVRMTFNKNETTYEESRDLFISWAKTVTFGEVSEQ